MRALDRRLFILFNIFDIRYHMLLREICVALRYFMKVMYFIELKFHTNDL
jgi:hypothetical protein